MAISQATSYSRVEAIATAQPVIPVVMIDRLEDAVPLARALVAGGLPIVEVTLRTPIALAAIEAIARDVPEATVGAGTIVSEGQIMEARDAGAKFLVSPGCSERLGEAAAASPLPFLPGCATVSEALELSEFGFAFLKFFPAEASGGAAFLASVAPVLQHLKFCPTGGIGPGNVASYIALKNVACVGGSWIAPAALIAAGDFAGITVLARKAASLRG